MDQKQLSVSEETLAEWMQILLMRAEEVGRQGEVPITAVILDRNGQCIGHGRNRRERLKDPLGHAELIALHQASLMTEDWRFNDCTLIVTLEPCPMCAGALVQARMGTVVFGAHDVKRGGLGGSLNLAVHPSAHHHMNVIGGVLEKEAHQLLETWFQRRRATKKKMTSSPSTTRTETVNHQKKS